MERQNSCLNTRAIIDYISRHYQRPEDLLAGLNGRLSGVDDPLSFLSDANNWVNSDVCRVMYANARRISGDEKVAEKIGFESVTQKRLGWVQEILLRALASPKGTAKRIQSINRRFNRNKRLEVVSLNKRGMVIRLHWQKNIDLGVDFCLMNQGVYSAIPTIWGLSPADVEETVCQFEGGPYCEFVVKWQNPSMLQRFRSLTGGRRLLGETLAELERDKTLLERKFGEVRALNTHLQEKIDQMVSIQQASAAILSELDYQHLIPTVLQLFVKAIGYQRGMIMLKDDEAESLCFIHGVGEDPGRLEQLKGYKVPLSRQQNILARVAVSGRPVICDDTSTLNLNPDNIIIRAYQPASIVILPLTVQGRVMGTLAADRPAETVSQVRLNKQYLGVFANQVALALENARMYQDLRKNFLNTVKSLATALEAKDPYTRGHSERVSLYSVRLCQRINMGAKLRERVRNGCILHDIGKIGVDRKILNKNGELLSDEYQVIRRHPLMGSSIVEPLNLSPEEVAIIKHHHERYDGSGYPGGLKGDEIPVAVRVVTICDAFDAMTSDRPYRDALDPEEACRRLEVDSDAQFDSFLVSTFVEMVRQNQLDDILALNRSVPQGGLRLSAA